MGKIPWRKERLPTPVFWPGESHGLYSPWGCKKKKKRKKEKERKSSMKCNQKRAEKQFWKIEQGKIYSQT